MFGKNIGFIDNNPSLSSSLVVKLLIKFSGGDVFTDSDNYNTLKLFNRLFISFTVIVLVTCFLLSTLQPADEESQNVSSNSFKSTFSGNIWVFTICYFSWSLSPMMNNLSLTVMHSIKRTQLFQMEYYQFVTSLIVSAFIYLTDYFDVISFRRKGYIYNSLYRSLCSMIRYRSNKPLNPFSETHQDVRENLDNLSNALSVRLFRDIQAWQSLPFGFWIDWEDYDNFDNNRMLNIMTMYMTVNNILNEDPFDLEEYYYLGCNHKALPSEHFKTLKDHKYTLLWLACSYVNYCNNLIGRLEEIFKCENENNECCIKNFDNLNIKCSKDECKVDEFICKDECCCSKSNCGILKTYIKGALSGCVEDCNALLYDINTSTELSDSENVNYDDLMRALRAFEGFLMRLLVSLLYGRLIDEYLVIHTYMKSFCSKLTKEFKKFGEYCGCKEACFDPKSSKSSKCCCAMYNKMVEAVCRLHQQQKKACDIMKGTSIESLIDTMPPISLSRSVFLLASFFHDFITSDLLYEKATCKCSGNDENKENEEKSKKDEKKDSEKKCCCIGNMSCYCCRYNSRVDDILNLLLSALKTLTDCDSILAHVISVFSSFSSFKHPTNFRDAIYPVKGIPPFDFDEAKDKDNVLLVFSGIYTHFNELMSTITLPGHFGLGSSCTCSQNESGLCPCLRELIATIKEVCALINKISSEIGPVVSTVYYVTNYPKLQKHFKKLLCSCKKLKCLAGLAKKCSEPDSKCCGSSAEVCDFICKLADSITNTFELLEKVNEQSESNIRAMDNLTEFSKLNEENTKLYKSIRGTRMGLLTEPSNLFSKLITYYKKTIIGRVPDYKRWEFYMFITFTFSCLILIYLARLLPYLRNVPNEKKFKYLIILYSLMTAYYFNSSFGFMSSFGENSSYYINLAIVLGMILSIIYSWLTQWFTYRMLLFEQFVDLYSRFRLLFPGSSYSNSPSLFWWVEGFVSFIRMDMLSIFYFVTLAKTSDKYNPYSFGFSMQLNVDYDLVESDPHIFTEEECMRNIKKSVFETQYTELTNLLDYRSFYHVYETDYSFMKQPSPNKINYPFDLLYHGWSMGYTVSEMSDRLYHLRELALKAIEKSVQQEAIDSNYDIKSITKLKIFFEFQHECLMEAPKLAVKDSFRKNHSFLSLQSRKLVKLYEKLYQDKWIAHFRDHNSADQRRYSDTPPREMNAVDLLEHFDSWRRVKMRNCDMRYGRNDVCKLAVSRTCSEFEKLAYRPVDYFEIISDYSKLVATSFTLKDIPKNFEVIKYLSRPTRDNENRQVRPVLDKIAKLIRRHSFGVRSSILMDFISVCKNIEFEDTMAHRVYNIDKFLIGEWIRWQGLHVSGDLVTLLVEFLLS
ncbi:hypothetical protein MACK_003703 [Theileria orientalis]|uniref:Uncharacterized protein n=1 Tax=Theileria orientalis TaxID=68886 RepID=A0A976SIP1_THEOR|nr:hypothetical protein MACK_003703 [Theileria orientalis]